MADAEPTAWHRLSAEAAVEQLGSDTVKGLSPRVAEQRLAETGPNRIATGGGPSWPQLLLRQFANTLILILVAAALVSGLIGTLSDTLAILVILVLNALIGFVQDFRAERALEALRSMAEPMARVCRGGHMQALAADRLVPGDILMLEAGDSVAADLRLVESAGLRLDEAALTGESVPAEKDTAVLAAENPSLGDRSNMTYKGTLVTHGRATGLVVATGMQTELGRIAHLLGSETRQATPLQQRLARFGRRLTLVILATCALITAIGILRGGDPLVVVMTAISLAVAAVPEALPAVITIALALGARRMARQQALIRRLPAVETLGSVTFICTDKTGTLTQNTMRAERFVVGGKVGDRLAAVRDARDAECRLAIAMACNNDARIQPPGADATGDPTEVALLSAARDAGIDPDPLGAEWPRIGERPFDADRKRMTTLHQGPEGIVAFVKGAPETLLPLCEEGTRADALAQADALAAAGYRVLAFAWRRFDNEPAASDDPEKDLAFLGLVALMDPERPEAPGAVAEARSAGIRPVMITGDHPATALAMAQRLGIADAGTDVITGTELEAMSDTERAVRIPRTSVYARMSPEQKIGIVKALQAQGEFVAMTGDGVNDAPALKAADIGVAMGRKGTDVAREAADMVLLDDNFATIVSAVREGRRIYDNIRRFVRYTMTSNTGEVLAVLLAPLLGLPLPFVPIQILWINLVTDGLPGLALSFERAEKDVMQRPPRPPDEGIFARGLWQQVVWLGALIGILTLGTQAWSLASGSAHWQTMAFTVLTLAQLANALAVRSERESLFSLGIWSNRPLIGAIGLTVALQLAVIYLPPLQGIFHTHALTAAELAICFTLPGLVIAATELEKYLIRRRTPAKRT